MAGSAADVRAKNTVAAEFEAVSKPEYQLVEQAGDEFEPDDSAIAVCDMRLLAGSADERRQFVDQLGTSMRTIGFAILVGHGVDPALHDRAPGEVERFFTRHSLSTKQRFAACRKGSVNQGYFGIHKTSNLQPDLVEGWVFCRRAFAFQDDVTPQLDNFWPDEDDEAFLRTFVEAHLHLVPLLAGAILEDLGVRQDESRLLAQLERPAFGLRLNHYPALSGSEPEGAGRMLGHEDMDLFTLLPRPSHDGLQVLNRISGRWIRLRPPPGSIILNTGDYLQRISNDVLPSTTHRVATPSAGSELAGEARTSTPIAIYIRERDTLAVLPGLGDPKYEDISAIDFHTGVMAKHYGADYRATNGED